MFEKSGSFVCALVLGAILQPGIARADDPHDPAMKNVAAKAQDRADTKKLNQGQLAFVGQRDDKTLRTFHQAQDDNAKAYAGARAEYERKMAAWRRAVAACKAGHTEYCDK